MNTTRVAAILSLSLTLSLAAPREAEAMAVMPWEIIFYPMTGTTVGLGISSITLGIVMTIANSSTPSKTAALNYVRAHTIALQHDIHLGGGPAIVDLAALLGLHQTQTPDFATYLFTHRQQLTPLVVAAHDDDNAAREFLHLAALATSPTTGP